MKDQIFRDLMANVPAPVTVVTAFSEGQPSGTTVSAFSSLSLNPKLVMLSLENSSRILQRIRQVRRFGINLLSDGQGDVANRFARQEELRFVPDDWAIVNELPRLEGISAWIECTLAYELPAGDHTILAGEAQDAELCETTALVYSNRKFGINSAAIVSPVNQ